MPGWVGQALTAVGIAFDRVTPIRAILAGFVAALVIIHGFFPHFTIDSVTIALLGVLLVLVLTPLLRSASFAGGRVVFKEVASLDEKAEVFREDAKKTLRAQGVTEPILESLEAGRSPLGVVDAKAPHPAASEDETVLGHTTYVEILAQAHGSPKLALLKLTGDLEAATSRLLRRRGRQPAGSLQVNTRELVNAKFLPPTAVDAIRQFTDVRNRIAHGDFSADDELVLATLDIGVSILNTIELIESGPMPGPHHTSGD